MRENRPSATAERVAMLRALHQLLDDPKVFDDPLALCIIGRGQGEAMRADPHQFEASPLASYLRAFVAARSRCAEDELGLAVRRGVAQYVILGAGLDTFAYRNPYAEGVIHVFEVDLPVMQAWKRAHLEEAGIGLPRDLTFAPIDFEAQTLEEGLANTGYDPGKGTFYSWLGVTEYLTIDAVSTTLRLIASAPKGSGVVFDYMVSPSLLTPSQRARFEALARRVASQGEPLQAFFDPGRLASDLKAMGFNRVEDCGPGEINSRYFKERSDGLQVGSLSHLVIARV